MATRTTNVNNNGWEASLGHKAYASTSATANAANEVVAPEIVEALLADELASLSVTDRYTVYKDVQGQNVLAAVEPAQLVDLGLVALEQELCNWSSKSQQQQEQQTLRGQQPPNSGIDPKTGSSSSNDLTYYCFKRASQPGMLLNPTTSNNLAATATPSLTLQCLRADLFDAKRAAQRLIGFLQFAYELFGEVGLERPIAWSDLESTGGREAELLEQGTIQFLPVRDKSGRRINFQMGDFAPEESVTTRMRCVFYIMQCLAEDEESQKLGTVAILYMRNMDLKDPIQSVWSETANRKEVLRLLGVMPIRISALHLCVPQLSTTEGSLSESSSAGTIFRWIKALLLLAIGPEGRKRLRLHIGRFAFKGCWRKYSVRARNLGLRSFSPPSFSPYRAIGSQTEVEYSLRSAGIPVDHIPITYDGKIKTKVHQKWVAYRKVRDHDMVVMLQQRQLSATTPLVRVECPNLNDVLLGRGRPRMKHPGNVKMRKLLESRVEQYVSARSKREKTDISWEVLRELQNGDSCSRCRFLKEDPTGCWWEEVTDEVARQKISIAFRDTKRSNLNTGNDDHPAAPSAKGQHSTASESLDPNTPTVSSSTKRTPKEDPLSQASVFLSLDVKKRMRLS